MFWLHNREVKFLKVTRVIWAFLSFVYILTSSVILGLTLQGNASILFMLPTGARATLLMGLSVPLWMISTDFLFRKSPPAEDTNLGVLFIIASPAWVIFIAGLVGQNLVLGYFFSLLGMMLASFHAFVMIDKRINQPVAPTLTKPALISPTSLRMKDEVNMPWIGIRGWKVTPIYEVLKEPKGLIKISYALGPLHYNALPAMGLEQVATCSFKCDTPNPAHECGLYASFNFDLAVLQGCSLTPIPESITGGIRATGKTIEHPNQGFRSHGQIILAILDRGSIASPDVMGELVASYLGVPFLKKKAFMEYLHERGEIASMYENIS